MTLSSIWFVQLASWVPSEVLIYAEGSAAYNTSAMNLCAHDCITVPAAFAGLQPRSAAVKAVGCNWSACLQVLTGILNRVGPELGPLLEVTLGSESGLQSFNFLGSSLLAEVDHGIAENLPGDPQASPQPCRAS